MFLLRSTDLHVAPDRDKRFNPPRIAAALLRGYAVGRDGMNAKRVTTTLTVRRKSQLERVAAREGVKEAWLVRRAVEKFLDEIGDEPVLQSIGAR